MKKKIFKISFFVGIGLAVGVLMPSAALAENRCEGIDTANAPIKAYLSESLGGGCDVFHVTYCIKRQATAPLRCTKANWEQHSEQCRAAPAPPAPAGQQQAERPEFKSAFIEECRDKDTNDLIDVHDKSACKNAGGVMLYKKGNVFAAWVCADGTIDCTNNNESRRTGIIKATAVVDGDNRVQAEAELGLLVPEGQSFYIDPLYAIETGEGNSEPVCSQADYPVKDDGEPDTAHPLGGTLGGNGAGVDPWGFLENECKTVNSNRLLADSLVTCTRGQVIVADSGTELLTKFIGSIYTWAAGIVGLIAVLVMVISGIQISFAQGDSAKIDSAKTRILESIAGLVILFLAGLILYTINPNFFTF